MMISMSSWMNYYKKTSRLFLRLVELVFPRPCAVCHEVLSYNEVAICRYCQLELAYYYPEVVRAEERLWSTPLFRSLQALYSYAEGGAVQRLIHSYKYDSYLEVVRFVLKEAARRLPLLGLDVDYIIPIPISQDRLQQRGYNQSLLLAKALGELLNKPLCGDVICRKKGSYTQTRLTREERRQNAREAFFINPKANSSLEGARVLLVDDVLTTGSTLLAVSDLLEIKGASAIDYFVIAVAT